MIVQVKQNTVDELYLKLHSILKLNEEAMSKIQSLEVANSELLSTKVMTLRVAYIPEFSLNCYFGHSKFCTLYHCWTNYLNKTLNTPTTTTRVTQNRCKKTEQREKCNLFTCLCPPSKTSTNKCSETSTHHLYKIYMHMHVITNIHRSYGFHLNVDISFNFIY